MPSDEQAKKHIPAAQDIVELEPSSYRVSEPLTVSKLDDVSMEEILSYLSPVVIVQDRIREAINLVPSAYLLPNELWPQVTEIRGLPVLRSAVVKGICLLYAPVFGE